MRLGYAPYDRSLNAPGDRRRFVAWAQARDIAFEVVDEPGDDIDTVVVAMAADIVRWKDAPPDIRIVYDITDDYLALPARGLKNRGRGIAKFVSGELSRPTLRFRDLMAGMCRRADAVVCTSGEQMEHVVDVTGHDDVRLILDCYDQAAVGTKRDYAATGAPRIAWEGLPYNVGTLAVVADALRRLPRELRPSVHVVTQPTFRPYARRFGRRSAATVAATALPGVSVEVHPWRRETVTEIVASCDVAIIPLPIDDPFAMSKSAQKLVSLWAAGMPVVTTATRAYADAMQTAGLGHLACRTTDDWVRALSLLLSDEGARRDAAQRGAAYVERNASRELMLQRWDAVVLR
jgi:glycosyltransferase involved in cell wall biosynthesis